MFTSLKKEKDFEKVAKSGQPFFTSELGFKILKNDLDYNRYGIVINLKVDKHAVVRNKIKRRIKEIIRLNEKDFQKGFDIMILTREFVKELNYKEIKEKLLKLFTKAKIFK